MYDRNNHANEKEKRILFVASYSDSVGQLFDDESDL